MSKKKEDWQAEAEALKIALTKEDGNELTIDELKEAIDAKEAENKAAEEKAAKEKAAKEAAERAAKGGVLEKDQEKAAKKMLADKAKANNATYKINKEQALAKKKEREKEAKAAADANKGKKVKLRAICNLSGKYHLPYSEGQEFSINEKQAKELVDNRDAEKA